MKVGDFVRVKAGSPRWCEAGGGAPCDGSFGVKLLVTHVFTHRDRVRCTPASGTSYDDDIPPMYLEPWRDDETWDATARRWVPGDRVTYRVRDDQPAYLSREDVSIVRLPAPPILYGSRQVTWTTAGGAS